MLLVLAKETPGMDGVSNHTRVAHHNNSANSTQGGGSQVVVKHDLADISCHRRKMLEAAR